MGAKSQRAPLRRQQVYEQLRQAMESGHLAAGSRLPATREHALTLGVSRNTLLWAMARLQAEGYVQARVGDGSYVSPNLGPPKGASVLSALPLGLSRRGQLMAETVRQWNPPRQAASAFRIGAPEVASFPFATWDRLGRQLSASERRASAQYLDPAGEPVLREAIAQWLWASRGIRCDAGRVLVCSGSQQAIDLVGRLLLDVGDEVLVEDPGYPGIRASLLGHGAQVRPVPLDAEGLCLDQAEAQWPNARLAVVTPTHQFPTGVAMSLARRQALLDWARRRQAWVVEDDYDGEFQYGAQRLPALCSLPQADRVLYVGTFSKTLHPGLRLGFIVLPSAWVPAFAMARALSDRHPPGDSQWVLARFIAEGHLLRHLRRMRELYQQRQQQLVQVLAEATEGALQLPFSDRGMHLCWPLPAQVDDRTLSHQAAARGVVLTPLSRYAMASPRRGGLFGYAGYDLAELRAAAQQVGPLLRQALRAAAG
ncbi:PLP-dependent aminotransferase family protein [Curvibacter sp. RS43]|uniref:MocR-like pyridoxine biosynthesis transcription factor PdxR n=1 Tax=Curvibacter microcysteis TaxID=3026419 RepID=UPI00236266E3|nr:PLP-dependent aminotransferase family protein [Curvibacter sp. RS43]MDD0809822.1 PLP-dependent aminotransferase family protein [Curvibacter sp. RS43]